MAAAFTAEKPTKVATLCTGYADGYPRQLSCGKGIVEIHGTPCPVLGRVCMDQMMVDVTDVPEVREDDEAILWGGTVSDTAETIARKTDTIPYEVLCGVSCCVPRVYRYHGIDRGRGGLDLRSIKLPGGTTWQVHPQLLHHRTYRP